MPETDTPSPMKHTPLKTSTEVLRGVYFIKECGDALRHPHRESAGVRTQDPILKRVYVARGTLKRCKGKQYGSLSHYLRRGCVALPHQGASLTSSRPRSEAIEPVSAEQ